MRTAIYCRDSAYPRPRAGLPRIGIGRSYLPILLPPTPPAVREIDEVGEGAGFSPPAAHTVGFSPATLGVMPEFGFWPSCESGQFVPPTTERGIGPGIEGYGLLETIEDALLDLVCDSRKIWILVPPEKCLMVKARPSHRIDWPPLCIHVANDTLDPIDGYDVQTHWLIPSCDVSKFVHGLFVSPDHYSENFGSTCEAKKPEPQE